MLIQTHIESPPLRTMVQASRGSVATGQLVCAEQGVPFTAYKYPKMGTLSPHTLEKHLTSWLDEKKDIDEARWYLNFLKEAGPG